MILTKKKAMKICIKLWAWLAETGEDKDDWPGWKGYDQMDMNCPLCEYDSEHPAEDDKDCNCPLVQPPFEGCLKPPSEYRRWYDDDLGKESKKKAAKAFLEQLKEIKWR